jgi:hypothetical protein
MNSTITPWTVTLFAAYLQYYTPKRLAGRHLSLTHLRHLSVWLGCPRPQVRSLRKHPLLAAHLTLLYTMGFLDPEDTAYCLRPALMDWLVSDHQQQLCQLLDSLEQERFAVVASQLNLDGCLGLDYRTFLRQAIGRQFAECPVPPRPAVWETCMNQAAASQQAWRLILPVNLAPWLLFDLLQLGEWRPGEMGHGLVPSPLGTGVSTAEPTTQACGDLGRLVCTPLTIARAARRGYGEQGLRWLLEQATQASLPPGVGRQLSTWIKRDQSYRVQTVQLLTTAQDYQLSEILSKRQFKPLVHRQLSPRDAVVSDGLVPKLKRWLKKQQHELELSDYCEAELDNELAYSWLGLRLLVGLKEVMPLSLPAPLVALDQIESQLPADQRDRLETMVERILSDVRQVIRGRDAFFPAVCSPMPQTLVQLETAIADQAALLIEYQSLGDYQPQYRRIQPYRLEQKDKLHYLYAYCYRAEADLTFRVDRISVIRDP